MQMLAYHGYTVQDQEPKAYVDGPELIRIAGAVVRDIDIRPVPGPANSCRPDAPARSSFRRIRP
jgi:hypothetical protein